VHTVDVPAWGRRERDMRNRFTLLPGMVIGSLLLPGREKFYDGTIPSLFSQFVNERLKFEFSWADVEWLRSFTKLPVLVKGVIRPEDAVRAAELGAAGVFVSNHGGASLMAAFLHAWRFQRSPRHLLAGSPSSSTEASGGAQMC
jgi:4-hydroxymandelate oxidase